MKQILIRQGAAVVEEVPAPQVEPGTVLVRVDHSCISIGTESVGLRTSGLPLWKRALQQPDQVRKVVGKVLSHGLLRTWEEVRTRVAAGNPTGYSAAGTVLAVGAGIDDLMPGDRVACAGAQCAFHAEVIRVPRNLVAEIPTGLGFPVASTATLGAIALQSVRRFAPTLGETVVVLGLGILGQLAVQLLRANGCRVIGIDLDRGRLALAKRLGMEIGLHPDDADDPAAQVARLTAGHGADGVIITAASPSDALVSQAFHCCRRKGRVVLVGDVGLHLNRADFYSKEIDFLISCSYGPGRYDANFEERGLDYPLAYVRWTETRNLTEYLRLCADGRVQVKALISATFPVDRVGEAYRAIATPDRPLMVLLSYPGEVSAVPVATVANPAAKPAPAGRIRLALVGAGGFAKGMHLPNLRRQADRYHLQAVCSRTGTNASETARATGAAYATTDLARVLADPDVDAILIATRHDLHASMALAALQAGKHVLLEKPMALNEAEVAAIEAFYVGKPTAPILLTGFNRRFSPHARRLAELLQNRTSPMLLTYRMNAGFIPSSHWVHGTEGGGRNRGEACHIYDLFTFLTGARTTEITASACRPHGGHYRRDDNFVATITFDDGSVANLTYTALGSTSHSKEQLEVFCDGVVYRLDDYKRLDVLGRRAAGLALKEQDKGQFAELEAFAAGLAAGTWPIPLWQQAQATRIANRVEELIAPDAGPSL